MDSVPPPSRLSRFSAIWTASSCLGLRALARALPGLSTRQTPSAFRTLISFISSTLTHTLCVLDSANRHACHRVAIHLTRPGLRRKAEGTERSRELAETSELARLEATRSARIPRVHKPRPA